MFRNIAGIFRNILKTAFRNTGLALRRATIRSLSALASALNVPPLQDSFLSSLLPPSIFPNDGSLRCRVQQLAKQVSQHAVVRIVDKGPGLLWGFCRAWAWDALQEFMVKQGYTRESDAHLDILKCFQSQASVKKWPVNAKARLALLYLIGKAKSRARIEILWRPIAAASSPIVAQSRLRIAARAFTCFIRTLVDELPAAFLVLNLNDMGAWVKQLATWEPACIGEADCKDQFNHVPPALVVQHLREASAWLKARRRWRATTLGWSIHKDNSRLDRAGPAKKGTFHFVSMEDLLDLVEFSLLHDNVVLASGEPWRRGGAIPMGGSFSAQSADLHCVWMCKKLVARLRQLGDLSVTDSGILQWTLPDKNVVALRQFRDNLMVAAKGPSPQSTMYPVCMAMEDIWNLRVLCPCRDKNPDALCQGSCMTNRVRCMGVTIFVSPEGTLSHAHPNALDDKWSFKFGAPLQSYWAVSMPRTTNVFLSALSNTLPFMRSWSAFLLSCAAWMQLAVLSGYPPVAVRASMSSAIHRILAKTEWDVPSSLRWVVFLSPRLPQSFSDTVGDLLSWLSRSAFWNRSAYASWHLPHSGACTPFCADWSTDLLALQGLYSSLSSEPRVDWGVHRGRGATAETR